MRDRLSDQFAKHWAALLAQILDAYEGTLEGDVQPHEEYEHGEMLLYRAQVLLEGGSLPAALTSLDRCQVRARLHPRLPSLGPAAP